MKYIVLHGITALEAWDLGLCAQARLVTKLDLADCNARAADIKLFLEQLPFLTRPLHILVGSANERRHTSCLETHLLKRELPRNSYFQIDEGIYVEAPYLCFASLAGRLPMSYATWLGLELCGRCSTLPFHEAERRISPEKGYLERPPLTTAKLLDRYTEAYGLGNKSIARRACALVQDNARSPRECILHIFGCFQPRLGGYGLHGYILNKQLDVPSDLARIIGVEKLEADMFWSDLGQRKDGKLALEYDGKDYHSDDMQRSYDNIRRAILRAMGVEVITIDKGQMKDLATFDGIMQLVADATGGPPVRQDPKARAARIALREELLLPGANPYRLLIP